MIVRITQMVLRICVLLALILGIIFWIGGPKGVLVPIHMLLGILVALSLLILGVMQATGKGGSWGLAAGAIILALVVVGFGASQARILPDPGVHWIIQIVHLLLGLGAAGMGEMLAGRHKRLNA